MLAAAAIYPHYILSICMNVRLAVFQCMRCWDTAGVHIGRRVGWGSGGPAPGTLAAVGIHATVFDPYA